MGNDNFLKKQNKKIKEGEYQILTKKGKYLSHNNILTASSGKESTFLICKHQSQGYYLKVKQEEKQEVWLGPKYECVKNGDRRDLLGNISWHFFQVQHQKYLITSQEIKARFSSDYQALTYDEKSNKIFYSKVNEANNYKNQIWQIYQINQSQQQTIHDVNKNAVRQQLINKVLSKDLQNELKSKGNVKKQKKQEVYQCSNISQVDSRDTGEWNRQSLTLVIQVDP